MIEHAQDLPIDGATIRGSCPHSFFLAKKKRKEGTVIHPTNTNLHEMT